MAVATSVMNVATYGFTMLAARIIGPSEYGAFAACLGLLIVVQVGALGLQATAARRIAVDRDNVASHRAGDPRRSRCRVSLAAGLRAAALAPVDQPRCSTSTACSPPSSSPSPSCPLTLAGGQAGILQGERRWGALSVFYLASGIPRLVVGTRADPVAPRRHERRPRRRARATCFPVLVGWWVLRDRRTPDAAAPEHTARAMLVESVHNAQVLFAFFALSSVDIVIARQVLDEHDAGLYAAGLIMTKVMLFLPQFVVVIAFPDMATPERPAPRPGPQPASPSAASARSPSAAAEVLSGVAMVFVGGAEFGEVEGLLWVFAVLGTVLAMLQLQVYAVLARQARRSVLLVWVALVVLVVLGLQADSVAGLVTSVLAVDAALLVVLTVAEPAARPDAPPPVAPTPAAEPRPRRPTAAQ